MTIELWSHETLLGAAIVFIAAVVRGYSGFGFSALMVISMSLFWEIRIIVPVILLLEIAASSQMLPRLWREIDWRALTGISLGALVGTPLGVEVLARVSVAWMQLLLPCLVISICLLLASDFRLQIKNHWLFYLLAGIIFGTVNGMVAIGGLMLMTVFLLAQTEIKVARATLVALFFVTDLYASGLMYLQGFLTLQTIHWFLLLLIPLSAGVLIGNTYYARTEKTTARRMVLILLVVLSLLAFLRGMVLLED